MFERVLNVPLHHLKTQTILQAKRKVGHTQCLIKKYYLQPIITHHHPGPIITLNLLSLESFKYWCKIFPQNVLELILLKTRTVELLICLLIRNSTKNKSFSIPSLYRC